MRRIIVAGLTMLAVILAGCGIGADEPVPTPLPEQAFASLVSVTGEVVPADRATVGAQAGGLVVEVLVEPGDEVALGDVLIRLDAADAELMMERARAAVKTARLRLALLESRPQPEEVAVAEAQVKATRPGIDQAEARLAQLEAGSLDAEIAAARAEVTQKEIDELVTYQLHQDTMACMDIRVPGEGEKEVCPLLGPPEEKARYRLQAVREELEAARLRFQALIGQRGDRLRAAELAVELAKEQQDAARAQLAQVKTGASPEEIAAAEAALRQAEVSLQKAELALERTEVRAPLAGTVGMVDVREQEIIAPGQPLVVIGDLSTLRVETTDLDEIDVARVEVGQRVDVTLDALPDQVFSGRVKRIAPMAEGGGGGVNYTTVVDLEMLDTQIRWGMTAFVDIEVGG